VTWSRAFVAAVLVVALTLGVAGWLRLVEARRPHPRSAGEPALAAEAPAPAPEPALGVLHDWDRRRAVAWSRSDAAALRALYTRGSAAGVRDVAMLRTWSRRGLAVRGLATQVLGVRVLGRDPSRLVLAVTDRVTRAVAVGSGVRRRLPVDRPSTWRLVLRRTDGEWRVASVRRRAGSADLLQEVPDVGPQ
jgi:hypothetical protein